jgi:site-specific DNA-methyltransferase (adenine-specific)
MKAAATWEDISSLTPWDKNPRHNAEAVEQVRKSIERFGFSSPIIARQQDRVIIAGHTRHQAALKMGLDKVPVRFLDLDPAQARALALADNRLGEVAEWDDGMLSEVLAELEAESVDLDGLGWSDEELAALLEAPGDDSAPASEPDTSSDDTIPDETPAITQPGDVITIGRHTLHCTDCVGFLKTLDDNSIDAIVTDPPYGIGFMGKGWDSAVPGDVYAAECLRVLKPGGHIIAFAATRTIHRMTVNLEDAGFEIRDQISWLQWQGFPKSHNVSKGVDAKLGRSGDRAVVGRQKGAQAESTGRYGSWGNDDGSGVSEFDVTAPASPEAKQWSGWGTALKPAQEPAVLARKPLEGTVAENVLKWGVGAVNIDGCRYSYGDLSWPGPQDGENPPQPMTVSPRGLYQGLAGKTGKVFQCTPSDIGRWPANIFACPKPARSEREAGTTPAGNAAVEHHGEGTKALNSPRAGAGRTAGLLGNHHPTVKPVRLMRWLVRLVTPPGATVLETFGGSGTTLIAAEREGVTCIATELEPKYCDIIRARLTHAVEDK